VPIPHRIPTLTIRPGDDGGGGLVETPLGVNADQARLQGLLETANHGLSSRRGNG